MPSRARTRTLLAAGRPQWVNPAIPHTFEIPQIPVGRRAKMGWLQLPIDTLLPEIVRCTERNMISLLEAAPGAGKTTRVPPALLKGGFSNVLVLEPRRLAARLAAQRVANELGEGPGATVGYQVRFDRVGGNPTKLWYLTEGVLTNRLLSGQILPQRTAVVLDEFHERHVETDLALALLRERQKSRPDLHVLLMSATLGSDALEAKLGGVPVIRSEGRVFPVEIRYRPSSSAPIEEQVASAVETAIRETSGHVLVFLPGSAEIRGALRACEPVARHAGCKLLPLHGSLSPEEQDAAVTPTSYRKLICSTNVAESSITIDGVEAVVDSGLARIVNHSHWTGISRLDLTKISQSSAIQRAGRAGRTRPGIAIRLYPESDFVRGPVSDVPEILRVDPSEMLLQLIACGLSFQELSWIDSPSAARELLERLDALSRTGGITELGRRMAALPLHPRLACLALRSESDDGLTAAAVLSEARVRVNFEARGGFSSDLDALLATDLSYSARRLRVQLRSAIRVQKLRPAPPDILEKAFLRAFPDRVARTRGDSLLLSNGTSARLDRQSATHSDFLIAVDVDDRIAGGVPTVRLAVPIEPDWLLDLFPDHVEAREELRWNREAERVESVNSLVYDSLAIDETRGAPSDAAAASAILVTQALEAGLEKFTDREEIERFLRRVRFASEYSPKLEIPGDLLEQSLRHLAFGLSSFSELRQAATDGGLVKTLESLLDMRTIEEIAPAFIRLPSGRRARIEYHEGQPPSVSSRLQDFFGLQATPTVAGGSVPLVVKLLAPNQRPVQVTTDLKSFWKNLYPQLRRELGRRYPKHAWPEIPSPVDQG